MVSLRYRLNTRKFLIIFVICICCLLAYPLYHIAEYHVDRHKWFYSHNILDLPAKHYTDTYFRTRKWDHDGWTPGYPKWLVDPTELQSKLPKNVSGVGSHEILYYNSRPADRLDEENKLLEMCPYRNCHISDNRDMYEESSAVIFEISHHAMGLPPSKRPSGQIWVFNDFEPPLINERWDHRHRAWDTQLNWSLSFRYDSDIIRNFGFLKTRLSEQIPQLDYHDVFTRKTKFAAWFVSSCGSMTMSARNEYVHELNQYIPIDVYGKCGNKVAHRTYESVKRILGEYKFFLSFENSFCTDYVTEKFFQYFGQTDAVLVVRGGADYDQLLPSYTHINAQHFLSAKDLATYLLTLATDETEYIKYLKTRDKYEVHQLNWACNLCIKINNKNSYLKVYDNIVDWWHVDKCWAATDVIITWTAQRKWTAMCLVLACVVVAVFICMRKRFVKDYEFYEYVKTLFKRNN